MITFLKLAKNMHFSRFQDYFSGFLLWLLLYLWRGSNGNDGGSAGYGGGSGGCSDSDKLKWDIGKQCWWMWWQWWW